MAPAPSPVHHSPCAWAGASLTLQWESSRYPDLRSSFSSEIIAAEWLLWLWEHLRRSRHHLSSSIKKIIFTLGSAPQSGSFHGEGREVCGTAGFPWQGHTEPCRSLPKTASDCWHWTAQPRKRAFVAVFKLCLCISYCSEVMDEISQGQFCFTATSTLSCFPAKCFQCGFI